MSSAVSNHQFPSKQGYNYNHQCSSKKGSFSRSWYAQPYDGFYLLGCALTAQPFLFQLSSSNFGHHFRPCSTKCRCKQGHHNADAHRISCHIMQYLRRWNRWGLTGLDSAAFFVLSTRILQIPNVQSMLLIQEHHKPSYEVGNPSGTSSPFPAGSVGDCPEQATSLWASFGTTKFWYVLVYWSLIQNM